VQSTSTRPLLADLSRLQKQRSVVRLKGCYSSLPLWLYNQCVFFSSSRALHSPPGRLNPQDEFAALLFTAVARVNHEACIGSLLWPEWPREGTSGGYPRPKGGSHRADWVIGHRSKIYNRHFYMERSRFTAPDCHHSYAPTKDFGSWGSAVANMNGRRSYRRAWHAPAMQSGGGSPSHLPGLG
jgi:hypothetical protein